MKSVKVRICLLKLGTATWTRKVAMIWAASCSGGTISPAQRILLEGAIAQLKQIHINKKRAAA